MINHLHRYIYLIYIAIWLQGVGKHLNGIEYSLTSGQHNYAIVDRMILANFLFGAIGMMLSLAIRSRKKTGVYFIFTCAIGLTIAVGTLYLDSLVTGNAAQAHMNSILAFCAWMIPVVVSGWIGIIKDLGAAINKQRNDRK